MQFHGDYLTNTSDDNENIWIHRVEYSTTIRSYMKVGENGEEDEIIVSSEDNKTILDELYNIYLVEKTLHDQDVIVDPELKVERGSFHPLYERSYDKIYNTVLKLKDDIHRFEQSKGRGQTGEIALKKLRFALITMVQVYLVEFGTYSYIVRRYGSILRKVFIDIWKTMSDEDDMQMITRSAQDGNNIVRRQSDKEPLCVAMVYISADNRVVKGHVSYPKKQYMIDVKNLTCDCPDFVYRKQTQGLLCKHLIKFQNECKCLTYLHRIVKDNLYNVPCPLREMLNVAYDENVTF